MKAVFITIFFLSGIVPGIETSSETLWKNKSKQVLDFSITPRKHGAAKCVMFSFRDESKPDNLSWGNILFLSKSEVQQFKNDIDDIFQKEGFLDREVFYERTNYTLSLSLTKRKKKKISIANKTGNKTVIRKKRNIRKLTEALTVAIEKMEI